MDNKFKNFGVMLDCSRNAVRSTQSIKRFIDYLSDMGYNMLQLYTEDTFEVDNEPRFGYLRGRYSKEELKDLSGYAKSKNIKLVPCIQTLAHLNQIFRWSEYKQINDCDDILLCGDEKTYNLLDNMFKTMRECFDSDIINIGMDEAQMLGLGKYLKKNGYTNRFQIILAHLKRVTQIAEKYNFKPMIWSDMFFRLGSPTNSYYTDEVVDFSKEIIDSVPQNLDLIYWDYYKTDKAKYDVMMASHKKFKNNIWFAGGAWCWGTLCPHNNFALKTLEPGIKSAIENGIENMFITLWGDDGAECSYMSMLPSLFFASQIAKGITNKKTIKQNFKEKFGIDFDKFMYLDLPDITVDNTKFITMSKNILYADLFMGIFDCNVTDKQKQHYKQSALKLSRIKNDNFGYLFETQKALSDVCYHKIDLGKLTREYYLSNDKEGLKRLLTEYDILYKKVKIYYEKFKILWFIENKPHGFDIQDLRLGGLMQRILSCKDRINLYVNGKIKNIPELEEKIIKMEDDGSLSLRYHYKIISSNRVV